MSIKSTPERKVLTIFTYIIILCCANGCTSSKVYVDTEQVSGLGVEVRFPSGKVLPIEVKRVISGNTIELTNKELVSYIGVYIPQLYNLAQAARDLNEKLVLKNQIRLEFDKKKRDSKGRLLAYAYTIDGKFVNAEIIKKGAAKALLAPPNLKHKELLLEAEEEARKAKLGVWSEEFKK